jgi:hypothetical protein
MCRCFVLSICSLSGLRQVVFATPPTTTLLLRVAQPKFLAIDIIVQACERFGDIVGPLGCGWNEFAFGEGLVPRAAFLRLELKYFGSLVVVGRCRISNVADVSALNLVLPVADSESSIDQSEEQLPTEYLHLVPQRVVQSVILQLILPLTPFFRQQIDPGVGS